LRAGGQAYSEGEFGGFCIFIREAVAVGVLHAAEPSTT
jgi:hypothetical protein